MIPVISTVLVFTQLAPWSLSQYRKVFDYMLFKKTYTGKLNHFIALYKTILYAFAITFLYIESIFGIFK